jgi:hypothetical protein
MDGASVKVSPDVVAVAACESVAECPAPAVSAVMVVPDAMAPAESVIDHPTYWPAVENSVAELIAVVELVAPSDADGGMLADTLAGTTVVSPLSVTGAVGAVPLKAVPLIESSDTGHAVVTDDTDTATDVSVIGTL